jgi:hypothetical protein
MGIEAMLFLTLGEFYGDLARKNVGPIWHSPVIGMATIQISFCFVMFWYFLGIGISHSW